VPSAAAERFIKMAEDVAASRGAIQALAAAIAVISGNDKPRSLLTATTVRHNNLTAAQYQNYLSQVVLSCILC